MKIGMIIAMEKEFCDLLSCLNDVSQNESGVPYTYFTAKYKDKELYIVKSGIGEIAAAGAAQFLITRYGVELILNFGICGGLKPSFKKLDTAVLDKIVHYGFDTSAVDPVRPGVYPDEESEFIPTDRKLFELIKTLDSSAKPAVCASADLFIGRAEDKERLINDFNADVCEMESAGILLTCKRNGVPCAFVKSVSDDSDGGYFEEYNRLACQKHISLIMKILEAL